MFSDFFWGEKTKNPKNPKSPENQLEKAQKTQPKKTGFFGLGFLTLPTLKDGALKLFSNLYKFLQNQTGQMQS